MSRASPFLLALLLVLSCDTSPITRRIKLAAQPVLPTGRSEIVGSALRVEAAQLEPLAKGSRYLVWAVMDEGSVPLGDFRGGSTSLSVQATALHGDPSRVRSIRVTEESSTGLPDGPSGRVRLEGPLGGALAFAPVSAAQAASGGGEARLEDNHLILRTSSLPALPTGLTYSVWARFPPRASATGTGQAALGSDDAGTMEMADAAMDPPDAAPEPPDAAAPGPDAGSPAGPDAGAPAGRDAGSVEPPSAPNEPGMVLLGTLDDTGLLDATFPYLLAPAQEIVVTVASARGDVELVSPVRVLRGELQLPAKTESGPTHTH